MPEYPAEFVQQLQERADKAERQARNLNKALKGERAASREIREALGVESLHEAAGALGEILGGVESYNETLDELEQLRAQSAEYTPDEKDELIAELHGRMHRQAFDAEARALGVAAEDLDDLFHLSGYEGEGEPDAEAIREFLGEARGKRPKFFGESGAAETAPATAGGSAAPVVPRPTRQPLTEGVGGSRGSTGTAGKMVVSKAQTRDYAWMKANGDKLREASKAGEVVWSDD